MSEREIEVFADWIGLERVSRLGILSVHETRGREIFSFRYDEAWLRRNDNRVLDPELRLFKGPQYTGADRRNFGLFLDSAPDRWGRLLMRRREAIHARKAGRETRRLDESDYLLGVSDLSRMGALRFRERDSSVFQSADTAMAAPPWASLRDLEYASSLVEDEASDEVLEPWIAMLIAPGSSLGGSRPKASVKDSAGDLWIAKFSGKGDGRDTGAWEMLAAELAAEAGIETSACRRESFSSRGSTFMTRRFDRRGTGRIHFASAMALLDRADGDDASEGASYLELAEFITRYGSRPTADLQQLWRRIVFSIAIANTDDHLRNHGFLLEAEGWRLSPAFDLNPSPDGSSLSLAINEDDTSLDFDLALSVAPQFRLKRTEAEEIVETVRTVASTWRKRARRMGIGRGEIDLMEGAFRAR